ncbi:MAG: sugar phosphate isomerase/epimerase family protein [Pyramidobacter sp.]|jgi:sugar phosphate isomerase/epimerase
MAKIFISSTLMWNAGVGSLLRTVSENGLAGTELWAQHFFCCHGDAAEYASLAQHYGLTTMVHSCSWDLNLSSLNEAIRRTSIEQVIASIKLARRVDAVEVTVHPGHMTRPDCRAESAALMRASLEEIAKASRDFEMPVSLEVMEKIPKEFVTSPAAMKEIVGDLFERFVYTIDTAHCDSEDEIETALRDMPRLSKIHVSNRRGNQYHTPLSDGDFSFARLLPKLASCGVPLVVEGFDASDDCEVLKKNVAFLSQVGILTK